ncbi:MAG: hypothetical protein OEW06_14225 [Gemmatimonadota bacterium]|nr:hypothetical protein [Gemmatimonadota bacterium]
MKISVLMHAAAVVQLLPPVIAPFVRRTLSPAKRWVVVWCLFLALQDAVGYVLASANITNLWLGYVGAPISGAIALWMLSQWHEGGTGHMALRVAIPIFVAVSVSLSVWVDDPATFSLFAAPFHYLVLLLGALWTFVTRALREESPLVSRDWFWILAGVMLYAGASTTIQAIIGYLVEAGRVDLMSGVFNLRAGATLAAFIAIAGGMLCPTPPTHSGGFSSPRFSRSPSW